MLRKVRLHAGTDYFGRGAKLLATDATGVPRDAKHGFWVHETRLLSRYEWLIDDSPPQPAGGACVHENTWLGYFIASPEGAGRGDPAQQTIELRVTRSITDALHELVQVTNHTQAPAKLRLSLSVDADFADLQEAGGRRKQHGRTAWHWSVQPPGRAQLRVDYTAEHSYDHQGDRGLARIHRSVELSLQHDGPTPAFEDRRMDFEVALEPHGTWSASLTWKPTIDGTLPVVGAGRAPVAARHARVVVTAGPEEGSLGGVVAQAVQTARDDLEALRILDAGGRPGWTFVGGWPTYTAFFGRDALAASWQSAIAGTEMMRASLAALASSQGTITDDWRDEQPGRMLHEHHTGPLAALRFEPHGCYYGDVTTSIYYPVVVAALWHWTGDADLVRPFIGPAREALAWADRCLLGPHGFYEYVTRSKQGEHNQGWKDSDDAIVHADGTEVKKPLGTCEMQAFVYAAKLAMSELLFWLGDVGEARSYFEQARDLKKRFNERFWMKDERYVPMAIDHEGNLVRSVASDPGHCLAAGIVADDRVADVAARLMSPDLFSGWGVRTLSASHPAYDPFAYHRGTVWPVENAVFALGFERYGLHARMHALCRAQFEAARLFEGCRLPECFGGHPRDEDHPFPGLYPRANWPQAWSASATFAMLEAMLGIVAYAPLHTLFLDPHLPEWLPHVTLGNLRVGGATLDLRFERGPGGRTRYEVLRREGMVHVLRQPSPQSLTASWGERIRDVVAALVRAA